MTKFIEQLELTTLVWGVMRFVIWPTIVKLTGTILFYTASKLGEQAVLDYMEHHFKKKKRI